MSARVPERRVDKQGRPLTAAEAAAMLGVSERHVRRLRAEPRDEVTARATERRKRAAELRAGGATYKAIADDLGCSTGTVGRLLHEHREREGIPQPGRGRRNTTVPMPRKTA